LLQLLLIGMQWSGRACAPLCGADLDENAIGEGPKATAGGRNCLILLRRSVA
jgi:hypothetical protein